MLTKQSIVDELAANDKAVARALVVLHDNQTADEQRVDATRVHNGMGFRPCHAYMGTRMAKYYLHYGRLTEKQVSYWRQTMKNGDMRIAIYWKQLVKAAEAKSQNHRVAA